MVPAGSHKPNHGGSIPSPATTDGKTYNTRWNYVSLKENPIYFAKVAQLVERQPSKLGVEGSKPFFRSKMVYGNHE